MITCTIHNHSSPESSAACRQKAVDKKLLFKLGENVQYIPEAHKPPLKIKRGEIDLLLFSEGFRCTRYGF